MASGVMAVKKSVTALCLGGSETELAKDLSLKIAPRHLWSSSKNSPKHLWSSNSMIRLNGPKSSMNKQWYLPPMS